MSDEVEKEGKIELITCSACGSKYGFYLHFCPNCRKPNETQQYKDHWGKRYAD